MGVDASRRTDRELGTYASSRSTHPPSSRVADVAAYADERRAHPAAARSSTSGTMRASVSRGQMRQSGAVMSRTGSHLPRCGTKRVRPADARAALGGLEPPRPVDVIDDEAQGAAEGIDAVGEVRRWVVGRDLLARLGVVAELEDARLAGGVPGIGLLADSAAPGCGPRPWKTVVRSIGAMTDIATPAAAWTLACTVTGTLEGAIPPALPEHVSAPAPAVRQPRPPPRCGRRGTARRRRARR